VLERLLGSNSVRSVGSIQLAELASLVHVALVRIMTTFRITREARENNSTRHFPFIRRMSWQFAESAVLSGENGIYHSVEAEQLSWLLRPIFKI